MPEMNDNEALVELRNMLHGGMTPPAKRWTAVLVYLIKKLQKPPLRLDRDDVAATIVNQLKTAHDIHLPLDIAQDVAAHLVLADMPRHLLGQENADAVLDLVEVWAMGGGRKPAAFVQALRALLHLPDRTVEADHAG